MGKKSLKPLGYMHWSKTVGQTFAVKLQKRQIGNIKIVYMSLSVFDAAKTQWAYFTADI